MKTVIEMADEVFERMFPDGHCRETYWTATEDELERFAEFVRADAIAAEREACAGECDEWIKNGSALAEDIAASIRNRSTT